MIASGLHKTDRIAVIGAGSWGSALAIHLAKQGYEVRLWGRDVQAIREMAATGRNARYLPGIDFPVGLKPSVSLDETLRGVDEVFLVVPSHAFYETLLQVVEKRPDYKRYVWASKGFEPGTARLLHQCVEEVLGEGACYAVVSGPTFAKEVALGMPTAVTIASNDVHYADALAALIHGETFRVYTSTDVVGVELGGAVKNVFAIAAGISDGLGFGANARAALITRSVAEMMRLGVALSGRRETFMGLTGVGDLLMTCTDNQSRNRRLGIALGEGKPIEQALREIDQVVEGIQSAKETHTLAQRLKIDMPIVEQVYAVLHEHRSAHDAVKYLLERDQKPELI